MLNERFTPAATLALTLLRVYGDQTLAMLWQEFRKGQDGWTFAEFLKGLRAMGAAGLITRSTTLPGAYHAADGRRIS